MRIDWAWGILKWVAKWGGIFAVYLFLLHGGSSFPFAFVTTLILLLVVQRNRLASSYLFADESNLRVEKDFLTLSVGEALSAIWMYGMLLYLVLLFALPMACGVQSWFDGTFLSKSLCRDASDIQFPRSYE